MGSLGRDRPGNYRRRIGPAEPQSAGRKAGELPTGQSAATLLLRIFLSYWKQSARPLPGAFFCFFLKNANKNNYKNEDAISTSGREVFRFVFPPAIFEHNRRRTKCRNLKI